MTAFAAAVGVLFADPNLSIPVLWGPDGATPSVPLRGIRARPDEVADFGRSRGIVPSMVLDLPVAGAETMRRGDAIDADGGSWIVHSDPLRDREGLTQRVELTRA